MAALKIRHPDPAEITQLLQGETQGLQELHQAVQGMQAADGAAQAFKVNAAAKIQALLQKRTAFYTGLGEKTAGVIASTGKRLLGIST